MATAIVWITTVGMATLGMEYDIDAVYPLPLIITEATELCRQSVHTILPRARAQSTRRSLSEIETFAIPSEANLQCLCRMAPNRERICYPQSPSAGRSA